MKKLSLKDDKTPPRNPPGDDSKMTDDERRKLANKKTLSQAAAVKLIDEKQRLDRKKSWAILQPDGVDRMASADDSLAVIRRTFDEHFLQGAKHGQEQQSKASRDRSPLTRIIDRKLIGDPEKSTRDIWNAIAALTEDDEAGNSIEITEKNGRLAIEWWGGDGKQKKRDVSFPAFEKAVCRRREDLKKRT